MRWLKKLLTRKPKASVPKEVFEKILDKEIIKDKELALLGSIVAVDIDSYKKFHLSKLWGHEPVTRKEYLEARNFLFENNNLEKFMDYFMLKINVDYVRGKIHKDLSKELLKQREVIWNNST